MKRWKKRTLWTLVLLLLLLIVSFAYVITTIGPVATGYTAKMVASGVFVMGQTPAEAWRDFPDNPLKGLLKYKIDDEQKTVTASLAGFAKRKAVFRDNYGVTLVPRSGELTPLPAIPKAPKSAEVQALPWPDGEFVDLNDIPEEVNPALLQQAVENAFTETDPDNPKRTRALVIAYKGHIIAERYAPGYDRHTKFLGWSMSKSIINALIGILVRDGQLSIYEPAFVPEWQEPGDPRQAITVDQLLRMSSGLHFVEEYELKYGVTKMLYDTRNMAAFAASEKLIAEPDSVWYYSSGTANILSRLILHHLDNSLEKYHRFSREELFLPLNMRSVLFEPDASGVLVGSSFMFATARDWARFGQLYLQDGIWNGERILPNGWVNYTVTPTPKAPQGKYGAHFWLNAGCPRHSENREYPNLPDDLFYANGHDGQRVIIIHSYDLVIVRLGLSRNRAAWDLDELVAEVLKAIPNSQ